MPEAELNLRDIHLPDQVSSWPLPLGWWVILGGVLIAITITLLFRYLYRRRQLRRVVMCQFYRVKSGYRSHGDQTELVQQLSLLIRRTLLSVYPREQVASLSGSKWLERLDRELSGDGFTRGEGRVLISGPYAPRQEFDAEQLLSLSETLLKRLCRSRRPR